MNLWVKRTGQLVSLAVALFFLSCQDDVSVLGYRNPNSKFKIKYIEIPLESSVFLTDSVRTAILVGETSRLLVGEYEDPAIGIIKAIGYTQIIPTRFAKTDSVSEYIYDSAAVQLQFDRYSYGGTSTTKQSFTVHEWDTVISISTAMSNSFLSTKKVPYLTDMIGYNSFGVNGKDFNEMFIGNIATKDTAINITVKDPTFGQRLWTHATTLLSDADTVFSKRFLADIKGLAILPAGINNEKIVGFNPNTALSHVAVYYHKSGQTRVRKVFFNFYGVRYTNIQTTFAPDLSGLMGNYDEVVPPTKRYLQQGTRVITKVDFANFYAFADTVDRMIINSCELSITEVDNESEYYHIPSIGFVPMADYLNNQYHKVHYKYVEVKDPITGTVIGANKVMADSLIPLVQSYQGFIKDVNGVFSSMTDSQQDPVLLSWTGTSYVSYMTLMAQHLTLREPSDRYRYFALFPSVPATPQREKAVNRIVFDKGNLKLKIYYTTPKEPEQ